MINLESVLDSGELWLTWIESSEGFHATLKEKVPWDQLDAAARAIVQKRLKMQQPSTQLLLNSLYRECLNFCVRGGLLSSSLLDVL
ncbi:MAG: hypothetical protein Q8R33_25655 [Burkholderiales bacterium]|nr:hypothetical protein [Burkholderiales bacterium]